MEFSATSRRLGLFSAAATAVLIAAYAATLALGLLSLGSPEQPIGDPQYALLEILIIVMMPVVVALMIAVHAWAPAPLRALSLAAVVFMTLLALVTSTLHFVILTLGRRPEFADEPWPLILTFRWPSVAYAVDIVGWNIFFALAMVCAAPVLGGRGLEMWIRRLMITSGVLAFAGLAGVATDDMRWRFIGIVGYVPVFLVVVILLGIMFHRTEPDGEGSS